jgi:large subunit ribosomal protein L9
MKIILNQDIINLGEEGDICDVANGYARNYLLPQKLAVPYNRNNLRVLESKRTVIEDRKEQKRQAALGLKGQLEEAELKFSMSAGDNGKLFGSVSSTMISEELQKLGFEIERRRIEVPDNHIRFTGEHTIRVKLYGQEEASLKVNVEAAEK